mmetsp:Transcript_68023/g.220218  ORF Transcript_68023/g.220218 Transcript_68023/m.220218 type:complete len:212 (-) Transcript_68023:116-751(-)
MFQACAEIVFSPCSAMVTDPALHVGCSRQRKSQLQVHVDNLTVHAQLHQPHRNTWPRQVQAFLRLAVLKYQVPHGCHRQHQVCGQGVPIPIQFLPIRGGSEVTLLVLFGQSWQIERPIVRRRAQRRRFQRKFGNFSGTISAPALLYRIREKSCGACSQGARPIPTTRALQRFQQGWEKQGPTNSSIDHRRGQSSMPVLLQQLACQVLVTNG